MYHSATNLVSSSPDTCLEHSNSLQTVTAAIKLKDASPWKESYGKPRQCIKKQRHHFVTKVHVVKAVVFPVVMYGCENWTIKKAERHRIDGFGLWCWRTLESLLDCKEIQPVHPKGNQSCIFIEGQMLKLKLQYFGHLIWRTDSLEKTWERLKAGEGDDRGWDGWTALLTWWTWVWVSSESWCWTGKPGVLQSMGSPRVRYDWATELNS